MLNTDELQYALNKTFEQVETEAEALRFVAFLTNWAGTVCTAFADESENENEETQEESENDISVS